MAQEYQHKATSVFLINYQFVWIAKRRRKILVDRLAQRLRELLEEKALEAIQRHIDAQSRR
jgi:putative transposase